MASPLPRLPSTLQSTPGLTPSDATRRTRAKAVIDFVMFFYEKIRTEASVVEKLNQGLKERYGAAAPPNAVDRARRPPKNRSASHHHQVIC